MNRSEGDVRCVGRCLRRQGQRPDERPRQCGRVIGDVELRQVFQRHQSLPCRRRIACRRFVQNELRDEDFEGIAAVPVILRCLTETKCGQLVST